MRVASNFACEQVLIFSVGRILFLSVMAEEGCLEAAYELG